MTKSFPTALDIMLKDAFLWQHIIFWNWFSGLRSPQGVYVVFWLSKSHYFPDLPAVTSRPHAHIILQSEDNKEKFKEDYFSELAGSFTLQYVTHTVHV